MILIVDDVPGVIVAFAAGLRRLAVPFHGVGSLADARAALPLYEWSGFVLDIELPDGNGVEFLEWLRTQSKYKDLPAVIITANILIESTVIGRINRSGAVLHCGAFTAPQIDAMCRPLANIIR